MAAEKKGKTKSKTTKSRTKAKAEPEALESTQQEVEPEASTGFPVVGIGASAGGLTAFEAFFSGMPVDTDPDMAFVLVQHLDPDHKSLLTELVRRYTRMQVFEVEDGMTVEPNCAYIIPPGRDMALLNGTLQLLEPSSPRGHRLPIDFFFRSLAQDRHKRAIGIVLSGTGSDGSLGVREIKGERGMVMVQSLDSVEYDGMPRNAIATGMVDYVIPPAEMPAQLINYTKHSFVNGSRQTAVTEEETDNLLKKIFTLLRTQVGHDFSQFKSSTIQRRIERRMAVHQIDTLAEYVKYIQQNPVEAKALFHDLLIGVTSFFRDPDAFKALEQKFIPKLLAGRPDNTPLRIWVPGCSTGEEAYSLAILLAEEQERLKKSFSIVIFATDIDSRAIATARAGIYPASIAADISADRLNRYFSAESEGDSYQIQKAIRDMLVFSEQDLIRDPPFSKLDLISCRNLLIYMGGPLQKKIVPHFHYALNPGGYLFLGTSEGVGEFNNLFAVLDRKQKLYQRKDTLLTNQYQVHLMPPLTGVTEGALKKSDPGLAAPSKMPLHELAEKALFNLLAPAAALVTDKGDILYLHGRTGSYLEPAPGETGSQNILKMAREGLKNDLATALNMVAKTGEPMRREGLKVKTNGNTITAVLTVSSLVQDPDLYTETPLYLVVLQETPHLDSDKDDSALKNGNTAADSSDEAKIREMEQLLQAKDEYLQTTNEELKSSNEEMQSTNEKLATVNAELQDKVTQLTMANNDMNDLQAPLRRIEGFSEALLEECPDQLNDQAQGYLNRIITQIGSMKKLTGALLQLSRVVSREIDGETVDLSALIRSNLEKMRYEEPERQLELVVTSELIAEGDAELLNLMIANLLDNAWKFTSGVEEARIELGSKKQNGRTVYYLKDNGVGFDMNHAEKLFAPFQKLHSDEDYPGIGIGLNLVYRIISRHSGEIWAEGEIDKGACFCFTLP